MPSSSSGSAETTVTGPTSASLTTASTCSSSSRTRSARSVGVEGLGEPRLRPVQPLHGDEHVRIHAAYSHTVFQDLPLAELMERARSLREEGNGQARHVLAEGLHPADEALPRRLPLLHVRRAAAEGRARVHVRGRGAGRRACRRRRRLPRGAVHARRQAGAPLPGRARGARRAWLRDDDRVPRPHVPPRARRDRPPAACEPGRDDAATSWRRCAR